MTLLGMEEFWYNCLVYVPQRCQEA